MVQSDHAALQSNNQALQAEHMEVVRTLNDLSAKHESVFNAHQVRRFSTAFSVAGARGSPLRIILGTHQTLLTPPHITLDSYTGFAYIDLIVLLCPLVISMLCCFRRSWTVEVSQVYCSSASTKKLINSIHTTRELTAVVTPFHQFDFASACTGCCQGAERDQAPA